MKNYKNLFIIIGIFLIVLFNSTIYGALNTDMFIDGDAYVRVDENIRITGIKVLEQLGGAYEIYNSDYSKDTTSLQVALPSVDSMITYEVTVINKDTANYELYNIIEESYTNNEIMYEILDLEKGTIVDGKTTYTFRIKLTTIENDSENKGTLVLKYMFKEPQKEWLFDYTGKAQEFKVPYNGDYKIELWGAQGGGNTQYVGGLGSYTAGVITLDKNEMLYVYVGEYGGNSTNKDYSVFNNGSFLVSFSWDGSSGNAYAGGGSTDIRLVSGSWDDFNSLKSRIMVAGAGGGANTYVYSFSAGAAGGLVGYNGNKRGTDGRIATGGTQTLGGENGLGDHSISSDPTNSGFGYVTTVGNVTGRGGNGYYAGGNGPHGYSTVGSGAGGSSFISGHNGCDAIKEESTENNIIHTGQSIHYSDYRFTDTKIIDGNGYNWTNVIGTYTAMPTYDGLSTMAGNEGNGYAKITLISKK